MAFFSRSGECAGNDAAGFYCKQKREGIGFPPLKHLSSAKL